MLFYGFKMKFPVAGGCTGVAARMQVAMVVVGCSCAPATGSGCKLYACMPCVAWRIVVFVIATVVFAAF